MTGLQSAQGWSSRRLKYVATYNDEVLVESTDEEKEIDYLEISGVSLTRGIEYIERLTFGEAPSRARRKVRGGDILISTVRTYLKAIARIDEPSRNLIASTGFCVVRPNDDVDSGYLGWVAKSEPFVSEVVARSVGVSYPAINASELVTIEVPLPPLGTQRRIARFLDEKTARIDALIDKKRELLDRLAEKRQALITRAVTKGLNPDAPMKSSGIEWLGDIPAHWQVKPLKYISPRISVGIVVTPAAYYSDEGVLAIRGLNVRPMGFDFSDSRTISEEGHKLHLKSQLHEGDLVAVRTGDPGTTSVITSDLEGTNCVDLVIIRRTAEASSRFLGWFLNGDAARVQYAIGSEGALQLHFNVETSKQVTVALPPQAEQTEIADYIERCLQCENDRAEKVEQTIGLLEEYRAALITSAVTGQLGDMQ
ncbi:MAG: restriction endonuclease subunit S [Gammaproteobacteria bacterium]|nr:restriction endonuclease subunit S [Gammaproteobacteria bacterium]